AEQEGQLIETEATGAPQKHHHTLNQEVGSITYLNVYHNIHILCGGVWRLSRYSCSECISRWFYDS
ncbi:hypothetical protein, partial [Escherichia coli]|uniref:hypothetical protein n=1 Tax=Escherichia coli TaxID=562 RepID=UPI001BDBFFEC